MSSAPTKSAVAIVLAYSADGGLRVLVGRRNPKSRFLGGFFAFPGGALETEDGDPETESEDAVLRRTCSRELREETGIDVAPEIFLAAGRRVTPPFFPRRFDTRMYVAVVDAKDVFPPEIDEELIDLHWAAPTELHRRWRELDVRIAPPLIPMLEELASASGVRDTEIAERLARVNADMEADGPRIEFVPDVLMVPVETPTLPPATHTNCYLVGAREFLVIDPGSGEPGECTRLLRHIERRTVGGRTPRGVVLTHHHADHTGGAARVSRELDVPVLAHRETWERWPEGANLGSAGHAEELTDGDVVTLSGGERLHVLHTPGHAIGHVALHDEVGGSLFAGDLVSGVSTILVEAGPGNLDRYLASLKRIRDVGARTLFPAHGPPFMSPAKGVQRVLDHRQAREERIVRALEGGPKPLGEIARLAYEDTPQAPPALARSQASSHLDRLERLGRVRRDGAKWKLAPRA